MPNIIDILARALSLRQETALNSITPNRAGGIMYDTLLVLNQMQLEGGALLISKVYASVSAMEADTTPTSDLTGRALKPGQLVVIVTSDSSSSDMGSEYRFNGPGSWTYVGKVGGLPLDTVPTQSSTKGITSGGVYTALSAMKAEGYKYMGIATPGSGGTAPGTPNQPVFYIAGPGSYPNFGSITVASGYLGFIKYSSGSWSVESVAVGKDYDAQISALDGQISQLEAKVDEIMPAFEVSPNLLDVSAMTADSRMNAQTGAIISDTDCDLSDYIEVEEGVAYISLGNIGQGPAGISASRWYFFDSSKTYIAWSLVTAATATVPTGAKYTRVAIPKAAGGITIADKMIAKGTTAIAYAPFYKRIATEWLPPVESQYDPQSEGALQNKVIANTILNGVGYGQQSIPNSALKQTTAGKNKFNPNDPDFIVGRLITETATTANTTGASTGFIPVKPGDTYVGYLATANEYAQDPNKASNYRFRVNAYDANKTPISGAYSSSATRITVPAGAAYIRFGFIDYTLTYNHMVVLDNSTNPPSSIDYAPFEFVLDVKNINLSEQNNDAGFIELVKGKIALPDIKAFAGYPINIYHWNIVDYMMNGYFFRCISKGELTRKKWSYTPSGAETFNLLLEYLDPSKRELNKETIPVTVVASSQKASLTVLVIGDSIINLATSLPEGGITGEMLRLASADNYPLTLLGTRGTGTNQHEGRGGWTAKMYCEQASAGTTPNAFWNPSTSKFDFSYYMSQQGYSGVDCVFINLGGNDMTSYLSNKIVNDEQALQAIEAMFGYMDEMITSIHTYDANIKVVINAAFPCNTNQDEWLSGNQPNWRHKRNTWMLNVASLTHYANMANVYFSWCNAVLDSETNMADGIHPNQDGFNQIGTQMYSFMRAIN